MRRSTGNHEVGDRREPRRVVVVTGAWAYPCVAIRAVGAECPEMPGIPSGGREAVGKG
ncbi:hypothetical protein AB0870_12000 [Microbacterium proteolyticum]|uniref:hypothetical protein n=1 Tax=Microbacterium proteolyticum TaxID=1572644 RepID=UPI002416D7F5|nr:hypothetical protein [Microbacterium proteolyticum]